MSNLVAIAYPEEATAKEVGRTLVELHKEHPIGGLIGLIVKGAAAS